MPTSLGNSVGYEVVRPFTVSCWCRSLTLFKELHFWSISSVVVVEKKLKANGLKGNAGMVKAWRGRIL